MLSKHVIAGAILLSFSGLAAAQAKYPVKPIRMIVGYAPGGGSDIMGRLISQQISDAMGQQVVVENRAGAAQNVAAEYFRRYLKKHMISSCKENFIHRREVKERFRHNIAIVWWK